MSSVLLDSITEPAQHPQVMTAACRAVQAYSIQSQGL